MNRESNSRLYSHTMVAADSEYQSLLEQSKAETAEERLLVAARLLRKIPEELWSEADVAVVQKADEIQALIDVHMKQADQDVNWKKQSESHGKRDTVIYYNVEPSTNHLTCRIETPLEASMIVPLLAVLNESQIYDTWMPHWDFPLRLGVRESLKLTERPGRGAQICQVTIDMPFPISDRQVVYDTYAVDCIDESGLIAMKAKSVNVGDIDGLIQPPPPGMKRIDFEAGFCIRQCPPDHPCLLKSRHSYPPDQHLLLLSLTQFADAHVDYVPAPILNFTTRTALGGQWGALLQVAEDVRDGKRPTHTQCIQEKEELYGWVTQRIDAMFAKLDRQGKPTEPSITGTSESDS